MSRHSGLDPDRRILERDESHTTWDESRDAPFPRSWAIALVLAAAAYALYRVVQTTAVDSLWASSLTFAQRTTVSIADGALMAALVPVAIVSSRRFPVDGDHRFGHLAIHAAITLIGAATWIAVLLVISFFVTGYSPAQPLAAYLSWLTSNMFAYAALVASVHALTFQHRLRQRETQAIRLHAQLSSARLEALKAQLHPHFLFNTLHTISELIHLDPAAADAMIVRLAHLLRLSIDMSGDQEVRLEHELDILSNYLELHRMRYGDRLAVTLDIDDTVLDAFVPPLLLQPLVENALRHGIEPRSAPGTVRVVASATDGRLTLVVADNGVGLPKGFTEGVGLGNTRSRLRELYGLSHEFGVVAARGGGTEARIVIPFRR
ncbi:MAG TPA: histidine kinase [Gemmatimonadaceae bacterium]|nr:histidine kinase [Gemmatimonadaceae bacterium]